MWVVKIGGSLQDSSSLVEWLDNLLTFGSGKVVIVAGGGKFADAVRQSQQKLGFDDSSAHKMALLAMEQYAHLLAGLAPKLRLVSDLKSINACLASERVAVWLPYEMVMREPEIAASWDVTSDGLAAWLAIQLQINSLILVKSAALPTDYSDPQELVELGLIDPFLADLLARSSLDTSWMLSEESNLLATVFNNKPQSQNRKLIHRPAIRFVNSKNAELQTKSP